MEWGPAVAWACLLGAGLALVLPPAPSVATPAASPRPPRLIGCVFLNRANVTCRWEAGDPPATRYTLKVQMRPGADPVTADHLLTTFSCTTPRTRCTAGTNGSSVRFTFCVSVTAHGRGGSVTSEPRCQPGRTEVRLPAVPLDRVRPVRGTPRCLNIVWIRAMAVFPVATSEIKDGKLNSQIEVTAEGQHGARVMDVPVGGTSFQVCLFRPDTSYTIRLRHRFQGPQSPWSPWSNARQGRTAEDAPSAAPAFWRRVKQTDKKGSRLISLLWKPLPRSLANGRVLFYNVTCQTGSAQILNNRGSCRDLRHSNVTCTLLLPAQRCTCALTASNSAGTSPEAHIWLRGASDSEPPAPSQITVRPLGDNTLDVGWATPADRSARGFVVEWSAVTEKNSSVLHWEKSNSSRTAFVITEGVQPMERYAVSVIALYGERGAGEDRTCHVYTRQGAPSAGPNVEVQRISDGSVELSWRPVPVELRRGFIRNYTVYYISENQPARSVFVPGHVHRCSLENLSPGYYDIFMQANTDAGAGAAGNIANMHISSEENSIVMYAILPLSLTLLALALMGCLAQNKTVKQKLCQFVPDPSNSSLAHWTPKTTPESMKQTSAPEKPEMKFYSEVILLGESERQDSDPDLASSSHSVSQLQTYFTHQYSPLPVSGPQSPQNPRISGEFDGSRVRAKTTSNTDLCSCSSIYSNIVSSQTLTSPPPPPIPPTSYRQPDVWQHSTVSVGDVMAQLGRGGEPEHHKRAGAPQHPIHLFLQQTN